MLKSRIHKLEKALHLKPGDDTDLKQTIIIDAYYKITKYWPYIFGRRKGEKKIIMTKSLRDVLKEMIIDGHESEEKSD